MLVPPSARRRHYFLPHAIPQCRIKRRVVGPHALAVKAQKNAVAVEEICQPFVREGAQKKKAIAEQPAEESAGLLQAGTIAGLVN